MSEMTNDMTGKQRGRWTAATLAIVLLGVEAVIVAESWRGLTGFAQLIGITGVAAWGVPVTLDGVSLVMALVALRAELAGEASGLYRAVLFVFTAASAACNFWHGRITGGVEAALYLGGMSIAVAVVFALALRQIRHEDRRKAGSITARLPRFSSAHWLRFPRLTWKAWSLAVERGYKSPREALDAALGKRPESAPTASVASSGTPALAASPAAALASAPASTVPGASRNRGRRHRNRGTQTRVTYAEAEMHFADMIAGGKWPGLQPIQSELHVGQNRATEIRDHLKGLVEAQRQQAA